MRSRFSRPVARFRPVQSRHYTWVRQSANDTAVPASPAGYQEDLLLPLRSELALGVNLPEITIWRIHLKISITIRFIAAVVNAEAAGVILGIFVGDNANTFVAVNTRPFSEHWLMYKTLYYNEAVMQGEAPAANNANGVIVHEFDIKARRKLQGVDDTLLMQVFPTGAAIASLQGLAWSQSTLITIGRR